MRYSIWSTGEVQFSWSTGGQVEVGKVRQTADSSAAGETSSRQNSSRSFGPL